MAFFFGKILGDRMSAWNIRHSKKIEKGADVIGCGVADGTKVIEQISGPEGGAGLYLISPPQTVASATLETRNV